MALLADTLSLVAMLMVPAATAQTGGATEQIVQVETGTLRGHADDGIVAWKGIPFAAPPVGPLRWRAPQPAAGWSGVRDARDYAHDCMQLPFPSDAAPLGTAPAEDCLYANVWRPAGAARKLPVMVWIYGGGFVNGGASPPTYSGAELARQGIMVVSFNYRLGRFGTFAHPRLTADDIDRGQLGDYGIMDQIAALRWMQRNIAAFGGDPRNVTIIGESAGGMSVHALLTSPVTSGLFARAVVQSGGTGSSNGATLGTAEAAGVAFARAHGIDAQDPQAIDKLRALPAEQVIDGLNLASMGAQAPGKRTYVGPVADGRIVVDSLAGYQSGRFAKVPVMIGATSDDIGGSTGPMIAGSRALAGVIAGGGVPVYHYRFGYVAGSVRTPDTKGAGHASDIPFFFHTEAIKYGAATTPTDRAAGRIASGYLVNFVKTGDPNGQGLPAWRPYADGRAMLILTANGSASLAAESAQ